MKSAYTTPEMEATRALALQGYRVHDGYVWWIANDDPEQGLEEVRIGPAEQLAEDNYWILSNHHWPTTGPVLCQFCHDAEAELGQNCPACQRQLDAEDAGEQAYETAEDAALDRWDRDRT